MHSYRDSLTLDRPARVRDQAATPDGKASPSHYLMHSLFAAYLRVRSFFVLAPFHASAIQSVAS